MNPAPYRVIPRGGFGWTGYARLWQGPDHLLLVESNGFSENYKRFFFAEIQAVTVRQTATGRIWNGVWAGMVMIFALIALQLSDVEAIVFWVITAIFLGALLLNFSLGPTCACHIRTAVQTERLTAINRLRVAERFLARIRPLIAAAQGTLTQEETALRLSMLAGRFAYPPVVDNPNAPPVIY